MLSTWDLVRPRYWYPMTTLEHSMMELNCLADRMLAPMRPAFAPFSSDAMTASLSLLRDHGADFPLQDDDDFFRDLPMSRKRPRQPEQHQKKSKKTKHSGGQSNKRIHEQQPGITSDHDIDIRGFSSYSFSSTSILDDQGRRVTNTRRRYEDSTGRLKALHEREVDGKKLRKTWSRQHKDDEGVHECVCSSGSAEEFEKMWSSTPFGEAQTKSLEDGASNGDDGTQQPKQLKVSSSTEKNGPKEDMEGEEQ